MNLQRLDKSPVTPLAVGCTIRKTRTTNLLSGTCQMPETISRVPRTKAEAKSSYNQMSRWYDMISGSSEKKYRDLGLLKLKAASGEQILEIGYGTGHCILTLAQAVGKEGKVCGIDISE